MDRNAFCRELIEWYWSHGCRRADDYAIATGGWLRRLYEADRQLSAIGAARARPRPAMAIWGPAQTGKSTIVGADVDARARYERREGVDGTGSALHWPGGSPMFFLAPEASPPAYLNRYVLNPFNQGWDGSSALTRFVWGSTDPDRPGAYWVRDVGHPVGLHLAEPRDLLQVVARGYDTECLGPGRTRDATHWTAAELESRLARFKRRHPAATRIVSRPAFEALFDLCEVLGDLVFAELPRYKKLLEGGEENWRSQLASLLSDSTLLSDPPAVEAFAADVLWDGYEVVSDHYRRVRAELGRLSAQWGDRPVLCTLEAAAVLLNMEACRIYFDPPPVNPATQEAVVYESISRLGWRAEDGRILVGCGPEYRHRLGATAEAFGAFQALVWELVVPLNPDHLPDGPFKSFLEGADLLDFAGVGNEPKSDVSRIDLEPARGADPAKGRPFEPVHFYKQLVKRGKTACIVSTYAKRLTIDGFNIFQNVDKFPPVNAPQLITGIQTWWKYFVPEYYRERRGPSPLPLNLGLMWWAPRIAESVGTPERIFKAIVPIFSELGPIADPTVSVTFAFNYYQFPRGRLDVPFEIGGQLYHGITASPEFQRQFSDPQSRASFDAMVSDKVGGGTGCFFTLVRQQLESSRANPSTNRLAILESRLAVLETEIADLLKSPRLFPPARTVDVRRQNLERFRAWLVEAAKGKPERKMREINHSLRELLDVNYQSLLSPPTDPTEIDRAFVARQFRRWVDAQIARFDQWERSGRRTGPDWLALGIPTREALMETLDALRTSIEGRFDDIARWLGRTAVHRGPPNADLRNLHLRRHLAVRMGNELVSGRADGGEPDDEPFEDGAEAEAAPAVGRDCLTYRAFVRPFVEGQLGMLINLRVGPAQRPENIPGDRELIELCTRHRVRFAA